MSILSRPVVADIVARVFAATVNPAPQPPVGVRSTGVDDGVEHRLQELYELVGDAFVEGLRSGHGDGVGRQAGVGHRLEPVRTHYISGADLRVDGGTVRTVS
jgi:hypothetical protein